ncbi:hypothetical protein CHS0354_039642 [Potamilus streckersoni]|uniref:Uncharacterized protein n=1 Tax=Potamilus streckersoni TaxID=2493646 RepID=A0AAE0VWG3_9BIVA|nr:hypothetical protein CHS0354_039642 [Potamilus streckersoni]
MRIPAKVERPTAICILVALDENPIQSKETDCYLYSVDLDENPSQSRETDYYLYTVDYRLVSHLKQRLTALCILVVLDENPAKAERLTAICILVALDENNTQNRLTAICTLVALDENPIQSRETDYYLLTGSFR